MTCYNNLSFKFRIFFGCMLAAIIPLFLSAFLTVIVFQASFSHQTSQEGKRQMEEITVRLSQFFKSCETVCENLNGNSVSSLAMLDSSTLERQKDFYLSMYQAAQELYVYGTLSIYDAGGRLYFSTDNLEENVSLPLYWGLLKKASQSDGTVYYGTDSYLYHSTPVLLQAACSLERPYGARTGYIVLDFTRRSFDNLLNGFYSDRDTLLLLDSHMQPIYCSRPEYDRQTMDSLITETMKPHPQNQEFQYSWFLDSSSGFYILLQKEVPVSSSAIHTMQTISLILTFLGMALCLIISFILSRSISEPVRRLDKAMTKVKEGDLTIRIHTTQKDELGRLTESFNQMTGDLQNYIEDTVQKQKDLTETRLKLYQSQLNPHFLYNTLDSIKWTAKINRLPDMATMAENLAVILRHSISSRPLITLAQELETLNNYIQIQKIRFSGRFLYELEIPDSLEHCLIPKMILQPLVENAILHGLEGIDSGYICIYAAENGNHLHLTVTDDGCGMSREMLNWINHKNPEKLEGHLGLYNIIQILKLYYGAEYGLKANLIPEGGTSITVILPMQKGNLADV